MALDRLQEAVSSGLSVVREALSCVPGEVDSRMAFSRKLLFPFMLFAAGSGCRNANVEPQFGWNGGEPVDCFENYFGAFPDEKPDYSNELAIFGAKTADCPWPEEGDPLGSMTSSGIDISEARAFLNTGPSMLGYYKSGLDDVYTMTTFDFAGDYGFGETEEITTVPANETFFCTDRSFRATIYNPLDIADTREFDLQIVGRFGSIEKSGQAATYVGKTVFYEDLFSPEPTRVPGAQEDVERVLEDTGDVVDQVPSFYSAWPGQQVGETWIVKGKSYDGEMSLSEYKDFLLAESDGEYVFVTPNRTY